MKGKHIIRVEEGLVKLELPAGAKVSKSDEVFYNPGMRICRDLSVLSVMTFFQQQNVNERVVLDAFAASGIRGLRYLLECQPYVGKVVFNDLNPKALEWIKHNLKLNGIEETRVELMREDARVSMLRMRNRCDVLDIDPFGSPSKYIDCAAESMSRNSMLGVTATDTAPLCGTYPIACYRKYLATSYRYDGMYEAGLRILTGFIVRMFAKHEKAFTPVLCFAGGHFFRVHGVVKKNLRAVNELLLRNIGYLFICESCGHRKLIDEKCRRCELCGSEKTRNVGPLWTGELQNEEFCRKMIQIVEKRMNWLQEESAALLRLLKEESEIAGGVIYDTHFICRKWKLNSPPSIEKIVEVLKKHGYAVSRTHLKPTAVKTTARIDEIAEIMKEIRK